MCPDREILSAWMDGEVEAPWAQAVEEHLEGCLDCRRRLEALEQTRRRLLEAPQPDLRGPMERVRRNLLVRGTARSAPVSLWRRRVSLPIPLAAAAVLLTVLLASALVLSLARDPFGLMRITRQPVGGAVIQIAAPIDDLEDLLQTIDHQASFGEDVIRLPKNVLLVPVGEPTIIKAADYSRRKP